MFEKFLQDFSHEVTNMAVLVSGLLDGKNVDEALTIINGNIIDKFNGLDIVNKDAHVFSVFQTLHKQINLSKDDAVEVVSKLFNGGDIARQITICSELTDILNNMSETKDTKEFLPAQLAVFDKESDPIIRYVVGFNIMRFLLTVDTDSRLGTHLDRIKEISGLITSLDKETISNGNEFLR